MLNDEQLDLFLQEIKKLGDSKIKDLKAFISFDDKKLEKFINKNKNKLGIKENTQFEFDRDEGGGLKKADRDQIERIKQAAITRLNLLMPLPIKDEEDEEVLTVTGEKKPTLQPAPSTSTQPPTPTKPSENKIFLMEQESLMQFVDELVKKNASQTKFPAPSPGPNLSNSAQASSYFQGTKVEEGEYIISRKTFDVGPDGKVATAGRILQDHRGVVTDASIGQLTAEQKNQVAIKAAKMILSNYPGHGEILIRAPVPATKENVEKANKMCAAVLMLQKENPELADIKILSLVKGCEVPNPAKKEDYIKKHLKDSLGEVNSEKESLGKLSSFQQTLKTKLNEARTKNEDISGLTIEEKDKIERKGDKFDIVKAPKPEGP